MKTNIFNRGILSLLIGMVTLISVNAATNDNSINWQPLSSKRKLIKNRTMLTVSTDSTSKNQCGFQAKLNSIKVTADTIISFEWQGVAEQPIHYTALLFKTANGGKYFIFAKDKNAYINPKSAVWHKVELLATELKTLKGNKLKIGMTLTALRFWQVAAASQKFSIRNFKIGTAQGEKREKLKAAAMGSVQIWPRNSTVSMSTGLEQFMFIEFPSIKSKQDLEVCITLPKGIIVKGYPTASYNDALPLRRVVPQKSIQDGNRVIFTILAKNVARFAPNNFWVTFSADVQAAPGMQQLTIEVFDNRKQILSKTFPVKIYPKFKTVKLKQLHAIVYNYNGLNKAFIPTYVNMLKASGINEIQNMHGETPDHGQVYRDDSVSKYALQQQLKLGLVFFIHNVVKYAQNRKLINDKQVQWGLAWLLDHPKMFTKIIKAYIEHTTAGINYSTIIIDSEASAYRHGKIIGDLSPYGLKAFRDFAKLPATTELTPAIIKAKYRQQWIRYRCNQSNLITEYIRELLDEAWPEKTLAVYSGYEFDRPPLKDRTRKNYGVDWKTMADTGLDYGIAGYGGSMSQISDTAGALSGKAAYVPAEMALVNFFTKRKFTKSPEEWSIRLISAFLNSGMQGGLAIWCGNNLSSSALISMNIAFDFMQRVESFALHGKRIDKAVKVYPQSEKDNVYVLRKGGNTLIIAVNSDDTVKQLRIRLVDFTLKGYTSDLDIKDLVTGKKIPAKRVLKVKIAPYSYRLLNLMDDGN